MLLKSWSVNGSTSGCSPAVALNSWGCVREVDEIDALFLMDSSQAHCARVSPRSKVEKRRKKGQDRMRWEGCRGGQWLVTPSFSPSFWLQTIIQLLKDIGLGVRILQLSPRHLSVLLKCFPGNPGMKPGLRSTKWILIAWVGEIGLVYKNALSPWGHFCVHIPLSCHFKMGMGVISTSHWRGTSPSIVYCFRDRTTGFWSLISQTQLFKTYPPLLTTLGMLMDDLKFSTLFLGGR